MIPPYAGPYTRLTGPGDAPASSMPDTVEEIDRQIQELMQRKKRVSGAPNFGGNGSSTLSTLVRTSSESATSGGKIPKATGKVKDSGSRAGYSKAAEGSPSTRAVSQEVCKALGCIPAS